jgi:hypothetical protein
LPRISNIQTHPSRRFYLAVYIPGLPENLYIPGLPENLSHRRLQNPQSVAEETRHAAQLYAPRLDSQIKCNTSVDE